MVYKSFFTAPSEARARLPVELIDFIVDIIIEYHDYRSLTSLACANKFFCERSRAVLYHTVCTWEANEFGCRPEHLRDFPHLGKYVHTYVLRYQHTIYRFQPADVAPLCQFPEIKLVNLKELSLDFNCPLPPPKYILGFKRSPFQLEKLSWGEIPLSPLLAFLETQTQLRWLKVDLGHAFDCEKGFLTAECCPTLEYLEGSRAVVEAILPGRKISILNWKPKIDCFNETQWSTSLDHLADEFGNLKALSLVALYASPFSFVLPRYLKNLKFLELCQREPNCLSIVKSLPRLIGVILSDSASINLLSDYASVKPRFRTPSATDQFFKHCPLLQFVDILHDGNMVGENGIWMFERWIPSAERDEGCVQKTFTSSTFEQHTFNVFELAVGEE